MDLCLVWDKLIFPVGLVYGKEKWSIIVTIDLISIPICFYTE
jgi:hypothetical protein